MNLYLLVTTIPSKALHEIFRMPVSMHEPYGRKQENGITFHDIRRTVKTNMLKVNIDKVYRDIILGHSLTGMDSYYMAPTIDDLKNVMDRYTSWFDEQLKLQNVDQTVTHKIGN
jgi:integrase